VVTPRRRFCCDDDLSRLGYDGLNAAADLRHWREGRLHQPTKELIEVIEGEGVAGARVLDIGAGVGAVHVALLEAGAGSAVDVDASREFLATARAEAERRGLQGRVEYRYGDVVELIGELPSADIVTLDSVICCYPYLEPMLAAATRSRPRLVGITYPRDVWWMRAFMRLFNIAHAIRRSPILVGIPIPGGGHPSLELRVPIDEVASRTASRMQSSGVPGRIHVAPSTRALLGDAYAFEEREPVEVKGLGPMTTYLLAESASA
jgi:magnesium-protoporphyrin O-methyltransferase